jgi:hypothetical protein
MFKRMPRNGECTCTWMDLQKSKPKRTTLGGRSSTIHDHGINAAKPKPDRHDGTWALALALAWTFQTLHRISHEPTMLCFGGCCISDICRDHA